jgi:hypothetical protein
MSDLPSTRCTGRAGTTGAATALTPPTGPVPAAMQQTACLAALHPALNGPFHTSHLEPEPGPLRAGNRLYYGKLPLSLQEELIAIGAAQPAGPAMRVNPRLLLVILAVAAKHLAQAYANDATTYVPHTDGPKTHRIAFGPLARVGDSQRCWQLEVGAVLPVPASDTPLG